MRLSMDKIAIMSIVINIIITILLEMLLRTTMQNKNIREIM